MWNADHNSSSSWDIEGYMGKRAWEDIKCTLACMAKENWPRDKETDKKVPPKHPNYIDEYIKWAK